MHHLANVLRGALIGAAELVPGVSGGTLALILGIYEKALHQGDLVISRRFRKVDWVFLATVGIGMLAAVFTLSKPLHFFVENHPDLAKGLFFGMVAVSISVPVQMAKPKTGAMILGAVAAILAFVGTGYTSEPFSNPPLIALFFAAMVAVCALVLPGVSGSFLLLALGLYQPVIGAVADRNLSVLGVFAAGAFIGLVLFVRLLNYALSHHRDATLWIMAGLMLGSLRALWPHIGAGSVGMMVLGAAIVLVITKAR